MPSMSEGAPQPHHPPAFESLLPNESGQPEVAAPVEVTLTAEQEELLQQKFEDARHEGWQVGLSEGRLAAQQEIQTQTQRWDSLMDQLIHPYQHIDESVRQSLLALAVGIGKRLAMRELTCSPDILKSFVDQAVDMLVGNSEVRVQMNPEDVRFIQHLLGDDAQRWVLEERPEISRGGVKVSNEISVIDATFESRLEDLMAQLMQREPS